MIKRYCARRFKKLKWTFTGNIPKRIPRCIIVAGPEITKSDFKLGIAVSYLARYRTKFLIPEGYFIFPFKKLLKSAGGFSYDPQDEDRTIGILANCFIDRKKVSIVTNWQSPSLEDPLHVPIFYQVAETSSIPIVMVAMDRRRKLIKFHGHFLPSGNQLRDLQFMTKYFSTFQD